MLLIHSDLLLDDLCALEVLGTWSKQHDERTCIIGTNLSELDGFKYGSSNIHSLKDIQKYLHKWFGHYTLLSEKSNAMPSHFLSPDMTIFILSPVTHFVKQTKRFPILKNCKKYIMGGSDVADHIGSDYNANYDKASFTELLEMENNTFYTKERCLQLFQKYGYEEQPEFLNEYITQMKSIGETVHCPDLMVINDVLKRQ